MSSPLTSILLLLWGCVFACLFSACASTDLAGTIPDQVRQNFEQIPSENAIAVRVVPRPEGEQLSINMGSLDYTMNRLFSRMVTEMAQTKFGTVDRSSENRLEVVVSYLNIDERMYSGSPYLSRIDMEIEVEIDGGEHTASRTFTESLHSDLEGYSIRSDQIYNMLLRFVTSIEDFVDAQFTES